MKSDCLQVLGVRLCCSEKGEGGVRVAGEAGDELVAWIVLGRKNGRKNRVCWLRKEENG